MYGENFPTSPEGAGPRDRKVSSYVPVVVCTLLAAWIWQRYMEDEEDEAAAPTEMYS